jgi:hypothetical protein
MCSIAASYAHFSHTAVRRGHRMPKATTTTVATRNTSEPVEHAAAA